MKASPDDVKRYMEIMAPFMDDLRRKHVDAMIATAPTEKDKREDLYALIRGMDMVRAELSKYVNNASFNAAAAEAAKTEE